MVKYLYRLLLVLAVLLILFLYDQYSKDKEKMTALLEIKQKEKSCITTALYHEARGEGELGMKAVASVIHNRYMHPNYPSTYCGVINQHKQFSYTLDNKPSADILKISLENSNDKNKKALNTAEKIADDLVEDKFSNFLPSNALHYATTSVKNYWTKTKKVVAQIGNHTFYIDKEKK